MEPIKVFLSSTYRDAELRQAAIEAIRSLPGFTAVLVEEIASTATVEELVFQGIAQSDIMVLIVAGSLGSLTDKPDEFFLEKEYTLAKQAGKPIIVMILDENAAVRPTWSEATHRQLFERLKSFRNDVSTETMVHTFTSPTELIILLQSELVKISQDRFRETFSITFDPELSDEQVRAAFEALADYYRACGGIGLSVDFEREEVRVGELLHV